MKVSRKLLQLCNDENFSSLEFPNIEKIPLWLQIGDMDIVYLVYEGIAFNYLVYGKAVMLAKRYAELEVLAEQFDGYFAQLSL